MPELENVTPAGGNVAPGAQNVNDNDQPVIENAPTDGADPTAQDGPPLSNANRKAAKEAKEAAEKDAKEKADAESTAAEDGDEDGGEEDDDEGDNEDLDTSVWGDTGDEVGNSVLQTLQNSGVSTEEAKALLWDAVESGDPTKVDRDALVEKVGKAKATLIMAGIENVTGKNNAKIAEVTKVANDTAGGKENWKKASAWAVKALPGDELDELRNMLDKGGRQAKFAVGEIVARYNDDPRNTALQAGTKQVQPDGKSSKAVEPMSRRNYGNALDKLHRRRGTPAEFAALKAHRKAGIKAGI